jgi:hypothetical protein
VPSKREGLGYVCTGAFSVVLDAQSVLATASPAICDFAGLHKGKLDAHQPIGRAFTAHFVDEGKRSIPGYKAKQRLNAVSELEFRAGRSDRSGPLSTRLSNGARHRECFGGRHRIQRFAQQ